MSYNPDIDHLQIVKDTRARFSAAELTAEQCAQICNAVAKRLQALGESAGLLAKTSGNNAYGVSVDYVCYQDGSLHVDILMSSGYIPDQAGEDGTGPSTAQWLEHGAFDATRWRPPTDAIPDPPDVAPTPEPEPEPPAFQCPQWHPCSLDAWQAKVRDWVEVYKQNPTNPNHLDPSPVDVTFWAWRAFIECWAFDKIEQDIANPGSVQDGWCSGAPKP
jgi:hypothetical protein